MPSDGYRYAIDLALGVSGRDDVRGARDDFETFSTTVTQSGVAFDRAAGSSAKLDAAMQNQAKSARDATQASTAQAAANTAVADSADRAATATTTAAGKAGKAAGDASKSMAAWSRAGLDVSRALEDVASGGIIGGLNNVQGVVTNVASAMGVSATTATALTAGIGGLATGAFILYRNWDSVVEAFSDGLPPKVGQDIAALKKTLDELESRPHKVLVDWADLDAGKRKYDELTRAKRGFEAAGGPDEATKRRAEAVQEAIRVGGNRDKIVDAAAAAAPVVESDQTRQLRSDLAAINRMLASDDVLRNPDQIPGLERRRDAIGRRLADFAENDRRAHRAAIDDRIGLAADGDEGQRAWLEGLFLNNRAAFDRAGVTNRFGAGLVMAGPGAMGEADRAFLAKQAEDAEARRKLEDEVVKEAREIGDAPAKRIQEADAARQRQVDDAARCYAGTDQAEAELFRRAQRGDTATQEGADRARAEIRAVIARELPPLGMEVAEGAADKVLATIDEKVAKHIANGTEPANVRREGAADKRDQAAREKRDEAAFRRRADELGKGFAPRVEGVIAQNRLAIATGDPSAVPEAALARELQARAGNDLLASGQGRDPALSGEIVRRGFAAVQDQTTRAMGGVTSVQEALASVVSQHAAAMDQIIRRQGGIINSLRATRQQQGRFANQRPAVGEQHFGGMGW